jgi:hypothetical protein
MSIVSDTIKLVIELTKLLRRREPPLQVIFEKIGVLKERLRAVDECQRDLERECRRLERKGRQIARNLAKALDALDQKPQRKRDQKPCGRQNEKSGRKHNSKGLDHDKLLARTK